MLTLPLHRITAWLCLVVALVTGIAPAQGFLLCVEQDGCVSVELSAASDHCVGCDLHAVGNVGSLATSPVTTDTNCPCIDFAVPNPTKVQSLQSKSPDAHMLKWFAMLPTSLAPPLMMASNILRASHIGVPRQPDTLLSIRCVVIRV